MPSPIEAAGAVRNPTKYGALGMGARQFTGMWTPEQRSPYRDAAVEYLVSKFYSGSRFDSIIDGLNREILQSMTDGRAPGSSVFNSNTFPALLSFYSWSYIQNAAQIVRTIVDGSDGVIYDATPGQKTALFTKTSGAGAARFQAVNTSLFLGDGVDTKKILRSSKTWMANTLFDVGNYIVDSNGNLQSIQANPVTYHVASTKVVFIPGNASASFLVVRFTGPVAPIPSNQTLTLSGLTAHPEWNGTQVWKGITDANLAQLELTDNQIAFLVVAGSYADTADTGTGVALIDQAGTTGNTQPVWSTILGDVTNDGGEDGGVNWRCFGSPVENWGIQPPAVAPSATTYGGSISLWQQGRGFFGGFSAPIAILDPNGSIQVFLVPSTGTYNNGLVEPTWATTQGSTTFSFTVPYVNYGQIAPWYADTDYGGSTSPGVSNPAIVLDSNGNLQAVQDITTVQTSDTTVPTWATAPGATTADGSVTWVNVGSGSVLWSGEIQYAWSPHCIDGTVGTASPIFAVPNGGLGVQGSFSIDLVGPNSPDKQCDLIYIWRTAQGQPTLILLDIIPNPRIGAADIWSYRDVLNDLDLNAFIPAPVASSANPPPTTALPSLFHLQRTWYISQNMVCWTAGPDAVTGNGQTQAPPLNFIQFTGQPIWLRAVTVQNGGIIVGTTDGVWIILGDGTAGNSFQAWSYFASVSVLGPNAIDVYNNALFLMESNGKVSSLAVQYPFNPQVGYTEVGFPIGDQFLRVTTGGINAALYDPATAFLSWNVQSTRETGMYVADGAAGWFRMGIVQPPESGLIWSPRRAIGGGTSAVQSVKTSPGKSQLLIGPAANGPILCRDNTGTVWSDPVAGEPTGYPSWDAKGVNRLCSTGQWAEVVHISTKSRAVGARPKISVLLGEIEPSPKRPYRELNLDDKSNDPSKTPRSLSAFSDRYVLKQSGANTLGDCLLTKFDYGSQTVGDRLLDWEIFGRVHEEREEEVAPTR
jgi:hypothetical protein